MSYIYDLYSRLCIPVWLHGVITLTGYQQDVVYRLGESEVLKHCHCALLPTLFRRQSFPKCQIIHKRKSRCSKSNQTTVKLLIMFRRPRVLNRSSPSFTLVVLGEHKHKNCRTISSSTKIIICMAYQTEICASIKMFTDKQSLINTYIKQEGNHDITHQ